MSKCTVSLCLCSLTKLADASSLVPLSRETELLERSAEVQTLFSDRTRAASLRAKLFGMDEIQVETTFDAFCDVVRRLVRHADGPAATALRCVVRDAAEMETLQVAHAAVMVAARGLMAQAPFDISDVVVVVATYVGLKHAEAHTPADARANPQTYLRLAGCGDSDGVVPTSENEDTHNVCAALCALRAHEGRSPFSQL